ncbi:MAG: ATP-binding protein [Anaerolineales bacterium]|nr:ATP-binding protein [Anaerolineales bacterium]
MMGSHETMCLQSSLDHLLAGISMVDIRIQWSVARARANGLNPHDEFRGLYISDETLDRLLSLQLGQHLWSSMNSSRQSFSEQDWSMLLQQAEARWKQQTQETKANGIEMRLERLVSAFALDNVEITILLLILAPEIDPRYAQIFTYLQDDITQKRPSINFILNLLTDNFVQKLQYRSYFSQSGRFLTYGLLMVQDASLPFLEQKLYVPPHIVQFLCGQNDLDEQLREGCQLLLTDEAIPMAAHVEIPRFQQILRCLDDAGTISPLFAFYGRRGTGKSAAALAIAAHQNQPLIKVDLPFWLNQSYDILQYGRLVIRDGKLHGASLLINGWNQLHKTQAVGRAFLALLFSYPHMVIFSDHNPWQPTDEKRERPFYLLHFATPNFDERLRIWEGLAAANSSLALTNIANQFRFTPGQIEDVMQTAKDYASWRGDSLTTADLFAASRAHSNQNLSNLATKIQPRYTWDQIVLPLDALAQLQEMVNSVRQRHTVYGQWGFGKKMALGKGVSALFAGESGTGKTMSADIIAKELGLDLYKVNLSTLVSKYIGETEKNLDRIFTEAATSNAILFFDEADSIFGKRSEVKDSHDRYANIEVSYLLQRMETYEGIVILATNLRANLDEAFMRRLHFAVEFPFPKEADRKRIWEVNFPVETPIMEDVDFALLARRFSLAGGNIRNIILAAAFLAAEADTAVAMHHLLRATRREYQKLGRLLDEKLFVEPAANGQVS